MDGAAVWIVAGTVVGLVAGSFLATLAVRWPAGRTLGGRSACDGCGRRLTAWQLVPILAHMVQAGRCRACGGRIDPRHGLIEGGSLLIGLAATLAAPGPAGLAGALMGWILLALATLDLTHFWLPDRLTLPLAAIGLAAAALGAGPDIADRIAGAAAGWSVLAAVAAGYRVSRGRVGLGQGDAKLFGAIGAWLGWRLLPAVLLAACLIALAVLALLRLGGRRVGRHDRVAFGAPLAAAGWLVWLVAAAASA